MPAPFKHRIITLASASPRRAELLQQIGVQFVQLPVDIDETPLPAEAAIDYVQRLALAKARAGWQQSQASGCEQAVLGADTTVVLDNRIMGKPADCEQALEMLTALSGKTHRVLSAVSLVQSQRQLSALSITEVTFRELQREEILAYWRTGEPADKAGSYAIQGLAAMFVTAINGSYSGVVGLPLAETSQLLNAMAL